MKFNSSLILVFLFFNNLSLLSHGQEVLKLSFQKKITEATPTYEDYYSKKHEIKIKGGQIISLKERIDPLLINSIKQKIDSYSKDQKSLIDSISFYRDELEDLQKKAKRKDPQKLKNDSIYFQKNLISLNLKLNLINIELKKLKKKKDFNQKKDNLINDKIEIIESKIVKINDQIPHQQYNNHNTILKEISKNLAGELEFNFKNQNYFAYIADLSIHDISLHQNYNNLNGPNAKKYIQLGRVKSILNKENKKVLMVTNGGMYTNTNNPEGLLISKNKEIEPIDLGNSKQLLNFYMMPNGVFYIDSNKANIEESKTFFKKYSTNIIKPLHATQSGPMLIIEGNHHRKFNYGSKSNKLRSGAGIMPNGNIVFIISNNSITNFFDFATIFKDLFMCQNALFLDGVISKMYLPDKNPNELGGNFGPIISVTNKN
tara:strand:- start:365 stop:1654 length:1290 start_codon:yes stop_codon:yes gene_type:complete